MIRNLPLLGVCVASLFSTLASAATLTAVGVDQNDPSWRTSTVVKPLDADGDNVYGTAGYLLFRFNLATGSAAGNFSAAGGTNNNLGTLPAYLSLASSVATGPNNEYSAKAAIDNPANVAGADVNSGIAYNTVTFAAGTFVNYFTFTIGASVPATGFRLGFLMDNSGVNDAPTGVTLAQTAGTGTTATATLANPNSDGRQQADWYFIDVVGAAPGDVITASFGNRSAAGRPTVGGITVDAIPEPGSLLLALVGGCGLLVSRRRQR